MMSVEQVFKNFQNKIDEHKQNCKTILLPCPFCGSSAWTIYLDSSPHAILRRYAVICDNNNCGAHLENNIEENAIKLWNYRATNKEAQGMTPQASTSTVIED